MDRENDVQVGGWGIDEHGAPLRGFHPQRGGSMGVGPFQPGLLGGPYETPGYGQGGGSSGGLVERRGMRGWGGAGGEGSYGAYRSTAYPGFGGEGRGAYGGEDYGSRFGYGSGTTGEYGGYGTVGGFATGGPTGGFGGGYGTTGYGTAGYPNTGYGGRGAEGYGRSGGLREGRGIARAERPGPRGYRRSDDEIREDVVRRLIRDTDVDLGEIEVGVDDARVILVGQVEHRRDKRLLEDVALEARGVVDVDNRLSVGGHGERVGGSIAAGDRGRVEHTTAPGPGVTGGQTESAGTVGMG